LNGGINQAIMDLVGKKRINAISCMSIFTDNKKSASQLAKAVHKNGNAQIGLHLTLSEYTPLTEMPDFAPNGFPSIKTILVKSHLRRLNRKELENEITAQIDSFHELFGFAPDFIDGHQHVHVLPVIRKMILETAVGRLAPGGWVRSCHQAISSSIKTGTALSRTLLISRLSSQLQKHLIANDIDTNHHFWGINEFDPISDYRGLFLKWLAAAAKTQGPVVFMCHPGQVDYGIDLPEDPIALHRPNEYTYFSSPEFLEDLSAHGFEL
ncbi:MAG: ChbG/HpnK family deacetylase, partial [Pseudomonadota bacterium]